MPKPSSTDYPGYYHTYISLIEQEDIVPVLKDQLDEITILFNSISDEKSQFRYEEGKWSIKEMIQHLIDGERIFSYRMLAISRGDTNSLNSFDQDDYARKSHADLREWNKLVTEFINLRISTLDLLKSLTTDDLNNSGLVNNNPITSLSIAYIIAGHSTHHLKILIDRYLI